MGQRVGITGPAVMNIIRRLQRNMPGLVVQFGVWVGPRPVTPPDCWFKQGEYFHPNAAFSRQATLESLRRAFANWQEISHQHKLKEIAMLFTPPVIH